MVFVSGASPRYGLVSRWASMVLCASLAATFLIALATPILDSGVIASMPSGSTVRQVGYAVTVGVAITAAVLSKRVQIKRLIPTPLLLYGAWAAMTLLWSESPSTSFKRLILFYITAVIPLLTVQGAGFERSVKTLAMVFYAVSLANIAAVVLIPSVALNYHPHPILDHQWRGLMGDKNLAGAVSALTIIFLLYPGLLKRLTLRCLAATVPAVVLVCSMSRTAMVSLTLAALLTVAFSRLGRAERLAKAYGSPRTSVLVWGPPAFVLVLAAALGFKLDAFSSLFANTNMLSDRGQIWWPLLQAYAEQPLVGGGFGSFWQNAPSQASSNGHTPWVANVTQAHNGYLDVLLQTGLIGTALALLAVYTNPVRRLCSTRTTFRNQSLLVICLVAFCLISNVSESGLLTSDKVWSIVLLTCIAFAQRLMYAQSKQRVRSTKTRKRYSLVNTLSTEDDARLSGAQLK